MAHLPRIMDSANGAGRIYIGGHPTLDSQLSTADGKASSENKWLF